MPFMVSSEDWSSLVKKNSELEDRSIETSQTKKQIKTKNYF